MIKLTLFASDKLVSKVSDIIAAAKKDYLWIDFTTSFYNYFEHYGNGNHGFNNVKLNTHGFRIVAVSTGVDNNWTDTATLFVASNFKNIPEEDKQGVKIIAETVIDEKELTEGFLFLVDCAPNAKEIMIRNYSQAKGKYIVKLNF